MRPMGESEISVIERIMNTIEDARIGVDALADRIAETAAMLDAGTARTTTPCSTKAASEAGVPPQAISLPGIPRLPSTWMGERLNLACIDPSSGRVGGARAGEAPVR
jgi:hypothetical protein